MRLKQTKDTHSLTLLSESQNMPSQKFRRAASFLLSRYYWWYLLFFTRLPKFFWMIGSYVSRSGWKIFLEKVFFRWGYIWKSPMLSADTILVFWFICMQSGANNAPVLSLKAKTAQVKTFFQIICSLWEKFHRLWLQITEPHEIGETNHGCFENGSRIFSIFSLLTQKNKMIV